MTTVAHCLNIQEAAQLQMLLEASGIPSFVPDEISAGIAPHHFLTPSGVRLQVAAEHAEEARRLIASDEEP